MQGYDSLVRTVTRTDRTTYVMPTQLRLPLPKGTKLFSIILTCSESDQRSGSNTQGSGKATGF
jgi:hypothetical protein